MRLALLALLGAPLVVAAGPAADKSDSDSSFTVKLGYDHTSGKYDQSRDTTLSTTSLTGTYDTDDYSFDVMIPYLREQGPGRVIFLPGRRPFIIVGPDRTAKGGGDVTTGITRYLLDEETHHVDLDLGAIIKWPTASAAKGLGTGEKDLSVQATLGKSFGPVNGTLTAGWTFVGKTAALGLKNSAYGSLDVSYKFLESMHVGATYSAGQTSAVGTAGSRDGTAYFDFKLFKKLKVEAYYLKGWSTQSPDRGGGVTLSWDL